MVEVVGKPIAEWQVVWLKKFGIEKVIFAAGHRWEKIKEHFRNGERYGLEIDYSVEESPLGTAGALKKALSPLGQKLFVIINGDILTDLNIVEMVNRHNRLETTTTILLVPFVSPYGIVEVSPNFKVKGFVEKPVMPNTYINGGIYILSNELIADLPSTGSIEANVFPELASNGKLGSFSYKGFWRAIDTMKDLTALNEELEKTPPKSRAWQSA